jgi:ABC-type nitrate/sulfonate/bicarbonate transport system substrate-binding protein
MFLRRTIVAAPLLAAPLLLPARQPAAQGLRKVHIGQATPAVSFLPLQAARALDTFPAAGLDLFWAAIPGGDPACLAALDSGDVEFAAVGSETLLNAITKGQPFQMVASLMSKVSLELVCSNALIQKSGIAVGDDPLDKRLAMLKGATIGVSAIGGTQDRAARWLARQAGLDPRTDIQVAMAGPPPSLQAALEAGRIDGFILSPPEGLLAEDARTGQVVVRMGDEFPALKNVPSLVLAAKTPVAPDTRTLLVATCKAMIAASTRLLADPAAVSARIQQKLYPRMAAPVMASAISSLKNGIADRGRFDASGIAALVTYAGDAAAGLDAAKGGFWTNEYWDEAAK